MKLRIIAAVFAGGLSAFVWSSVSWMAIPWHQPTMSVFEDEESIGSLIKAAAPQAGIYTYPGWTDDAADMEAKHAEGPYVFASIVPSGVGSEMPQMMGMGFVVNLLGAALLLALILLLPHPSWGRRTLVAFVAALFIGVVPPLMDWNWWHFPIGFTAVAILDGVVGWTLAGSVMALIVSKKRAPAVND